MPWLRSLWIRLLGSLRRDRSDDGFAAELDAHIALDTEAGIRAGLAPEEARRRAMIRLGGAEQIHQALRERRGLAWAENLAHDLRYSLRTLRRSPGFTLTAVITLGLGIGACTAIFSMVNAVLIRSLPYGDPERLVYLFTPSPTLKIPDEVISPAYGNFYDVMRQGRSYESATNFEQRMFSVTVPGAGQAAAQRIGAAAVDENFFTTLQSAPELGRVLNASDNEPGRDKVAIISEGLWTTMFAGDPSVLTRSLAFDGANYRIVGVMGPGFEYPFSSDLPYGNSAIKKTQIWIPLALTPKQKEVRSPGSNVSVARLRAGVTVREANSELNTIMARLDKQYPGVGDFNDINDWRGLVESFLAISVGPVRPLMRLLLATVALVLLIACANAANLLLARAAGRARELGLRAALGAGRSRMVRQMLVDALLICFGGGALGVGLTFLFLRLLPRLDPGNIPRLHEASLDGRVLLVALGASLFTGVLTGIFPALNATRLEPLDFLRPHGVGGGTARHGRVQGALIIAQTATVVLLLAGAGLLIRSYINVQGVDKGFSSSTVTMNLSLDDRYPKPEQRSAFNTQLIARLKALPGVQAVGAINMLPLTRSESVGFYIIEGFPNRKDQLIEGRSVTSGYFAAMGIPVLQGRAFTDSETESSRTAIVNQQFVRTYLSNRSPLGAHISSDAKKPDWLTVVGVISDVRHTGLEVDPEPQVYRPNRQQNLDGDYMAVRSTLPAATVESQMRAVVRSLDPGVAPTNLETMGDLVSEASARRRFQTSLLTAFAVIALVLALVGLYGVMAYAVNRRTREVGIRMALGASRGDVLVMVLRHAGALVGSGLVAGLVCTLLATRALRSFLFGVSEHDPKTVAAVSVLLMVCGLLAALVPARRAASADPMQSLRAE